MNRYIQRNQRKSFKAVNFDDLCNTNHNLFTIDFDWDMEDMNDYTVVDETIKLMKLNRCQEDVLSYRMSGIGSSEIANSLSIGIRTVQRSIQRVREKYLMAFSNTLPLSLRI